MPRSPGPLWAGPWSPCGRPWALAGWALVGPPWALVGTPGPLWAGPLWATLGSCGPPWALVGRALVGSPGTLWAPWTLVGPPGPLWDSLGPCGPPLALMGRTLIRPPHQGSYAPWGSEALRDPPDICLYIRYIDICMQTTANRATRSKKQCAVLPARTALGGAFLQPSADRRHPLIVLAIT